MSVPAEIEVQFADQEPPLNCRSIEEMDSLLDRLHSQCPREHPICVNVVIPGYCLTIGLGSDPTFLLESVEPCDGEWYISVGDPSTSGWKDFYGCGGHTPFEVRSFVPVQLARQALREFVQTQARSRLIHWNDWDGNPA
jgi:hypothetical protein